MGIEQSESSYGNHHWQRPDLHLSVALQPQGEDGAAMSDPLSYSNPLFQNARLKYTIDRMGLDAFKAEVEKRLGWALAPPRPFKFTANIDTFGWSTGYNGKHHFTMFIENGRVQDEPGKDFKTGLREIAKVHKGKFRLTANQHMILADVADAELPLMKSLLAKYKLDNIAFSGLRLSSSACVAFPTCGEHVASRIPCLITSDEARLTISRTCDG